MMYSPKVYITVFITFVFGLVCLLLSSNVYYDLNIFGLIFFFALYISSELLLVKLPKGGAVSFGFAVDLAALLTFGPFVAGLLCLGEAVGRVILHESSHIKSVFNISATWIALTFTGVVYKAIGGLYGNFELGRDFLPLFVASGGYLLINVTLSTLIITYANNLHLKSTWESNIKWSIPSLIALAPQGYLLAVIYSHLGVLGALFYFVPLLLARYSFNQYVDMKEAHLSVVQALATALEAKDSYTKGHSDRVVQYVEAICRRLRLSENITEEFIRGAAMHDIGKIGIPEEILNKPDQLTEEEYELIKMHPTIGYKILTEVNFLASVANVIKYHHEWFDGSRGYPKELKMEDIPLGARILMVADCFDAMTSDRPYRKALSVEQAINELVKGGGTQFDPIIVEAFIECIEKGEVSLNDGNSNDCNCARSC